MPTRIEDEKWILYRHTNNLDIVKAVAVNLHTYSNSSISNEDKQRLNQKLKDLAYYRERNPSMPLDAINHKINTLAYFLFGHKTIIDGGQRFLFSPLGNLMLEEFQNKERSAKIFLTQLFGIQFPHPHGGASSSFTLYPYRLLFKLLLDERLLRKLYSIEITTILVFVKKIDEDEYENLVKGILEFRKLSHEKKIAKLREKYHAHVNAYYEWDYYQAKLFESAGLLTRTEGTEIIKMSHGTSTRRTIKHNYVEIDEAIRPYLEQLLVNHTPFKVPFDLNDPSRLKSDVIKEIYSFFPEDLIVELGIETSTGFNYVLQLMRAIEYHSENPETDSPYKFEELLTDAFNHFSDVEAEWIGGSGNTDIECLYLPDRSKFCIDGKSTSRKLTLVNSGRLRAHRERVGGAYTVVITPRYVPSVLHDIRYDNVVILRPSTLTEFLYQVVTNRNLKSEYEPIHNIILNSRGTDISAELSNYTFKMFGS